MPLGELLPMLWESIRGHKLRAALTILGIVIGIAAVVILSSIGEGTKQGIMAQFTQFGTTLISVIPGKSETFGAPGSLLGTTRPLTLEDVDSIRRIPGVREVAASHAAVAEVEFEEKSRSVYVYGCLGEGETVWKWGPQAGTFIPRGDPYQIPAVCVLGYTLANELFGDETALGKLVRIGAARFRVIGVMEAKGKILGFDLDDAAYIPIVRAMRLFNQDEIHEIQVEAASYEEIDAVVERIKEVLTDRHSGEEDFTVISQAAMLEMVDNIMGIITKGVIAIAGIAIFVGAMGILTITWVSVHERTSEIGLLKAIGASNGQVLMIFLSEAVLLSTLGGLVGVTIGILWGQLLMWALPGLRVELAPGIVPLCILVSMAVGAAAGFAPARRAAKLDPVTALREE
jgi:putative ABC transport system permease protein